MARGRQLRDAKAAALAALGKDLSRRAGSACELCAGKEGTRPQPVPPPDTATLDSAILACASCRDQLEGGRLLDPEDLRFLTTAIWSEVPPVQVAAIRLLLRVIDLDVDWAIEAHDGLWLDEDMQARIQG